MEQSVIYTGKNELRAFLRDKRRQLDPGYRKEADDAIRTRLERQPVYGQAETVFCYVSIGEEVDTRQLIADMLADGKHVTAPRCCAAEGTAAVSEGSCVRAKKTVKPVREGLMEAYEIRSLSDLVPGAYGIPEPKEACRPVAPEEIDLCIVPCLCVGPEGIRLGYGGGYYDRYLPRLRSDAVCAALCRESLQGAAVPAGPHDWPMDMAITETQVIFY